MQMCSRCHKRVAVVFIAKTENNNTTTDGLCLKCAQELGIRPVNDMLSKMGISEEMLESIGNELQMELSDDNEEGGAPAVELPKIFQNLPFPFAKPPKNDGNEKGNAQSPEDK
ncbi:MAG: ATP-dependent Clp protease ATP-binding subunit, partial [Clostridia bacterium]|nr:ATP-dependent Clp protease ATP-binding subunit [Clostridia bacterium]